MLKPFADLYWLVRGCCFEGLQACYVRCFEYSNRRFALADRYLRRENRRAKLTRAYYQYLRERQIDWRQAPYGQTPLLTMRRLIDGFAIKPTHRLLELGCGKGQLAFWLASQTGCRVIGVDHLDCFIRAAKHAAHEAGFRKEELEFICTDLVHAPYEEADIVYFYGTGLGDDLYERLCLRLAQMERPPWVITVGGPLHEYHPGFYTIQQMPAVFPWGWTHAYLNAYAAG